MSNRAFYRTDLAESWEEIWEAGPYYERVTALLDDAKQYAIFLGWQIDSRLPLRGERLYDKLLRLCHEKPAFHIYFLLWDHSYFYVTERETWQGRIWDQLHPRIHFVFDNRHPWGAAHHEKVCLFDGKIVLCGGIDLCNERWDSPEHLYSDPRRSLDGTQEKFGPYHDFAVQVSGPICRTIHAHIQTRWNRISAVPFPEVRGEFDPLHQTRSLHRVYVSRTKPEEWETPLNRVPTVREIEFLFRDLVFSAEHRIILEGQYFWSRIFNDILISKMLQMQGKNFEVVLILAHLEEIRSLTRFMSGFQLQLLRRTQIAANFAGVRFVMGSPLVLGPMQAKHIYIHSKVMIIDDRFLMTGSANFAERALRIDTELQLTLEANSLQERCHIEALSQTMERHWHYNSHDLSSERFFRPCYPVHALTHLRPRLKWATWFPLCRFFDPPLSLSARVKRAIFRNWISTRWAAIFCIGMLLLAGCLASLLVLSTVFGIQLFDPPEWQPAWHSEWSFIYCLISSSLWLFPLPVMWSCLLAILKLGFYQALAISITGVWISSIFGYCLARSFPSFLERYCFEDFNFNLYIYFGIRKFSGYLSILVNPFVSTQAKIIGSGLYFIPFPWFILGMCLIFPSFIYFIAVCIFLPSFYFLKYFLLNFFSFPIAEELKNSAGLMLMGVALWAAGKSLFKAYRS